MNIIKKIKLFACNYYLNKELDNVKREKKIINLKEAKNIAVLYCLTDEQSLDTINKFVKGLQNDHNNKVIAIGFIENKYIPNYFFPKFYNHLITLKDLNWYGKPKNTFVTDFLKEEYDILINLSLEDIYPLQYICGLSKAKLKVGKYGDNNKKYYDFMIQINKKTTLDDFIKQIIHYLTIIKPPK